MIIVEGDNFVSGYSHFSSTIQNFFHSASAKQTFEKIFFKANLGHTCSMIPGHEMFD